MSSLPTATLPLPARTRAGVRLDDVDSAMAMISVFIAHHAIGLAGLVVAMALVPSILRSRRPTGSALAWLLALVLIPYVGIPLYIAFGGRKFRASVAAKGVLRLGGEQRSDPRTVLEAVLGADIPGPSPLSSLQWFSDGEPAYRAMLEGIEGATRSIRIVTYLVGDDATGKAILSALARKAAAGVEVRLLVDDLLFYSAPRAPVAALKQAGGKVARFMPLLHLPFRGRANLRNHRKIAIFDGEAAILGGMNLAQEYMGAEPFQGRWRDLALRVAGPLVETLDTIFRSDWRFAAGVDLPEALGRPPASPAPADVVVEAARQEDLPGSGRRPLAQVVPSGPDRPDDSLYNVIAQAVFGATTRVWIATPYFVPDDPLYLALDLAVRRGVDVRIVVPARSNHRLADLVAASLLRDLGRAGADVRLFGPGMLHAKALLVDESVAIVGSANFDSRSLYLDYEAALLLYGEDEARWLAGWFEDTCRSAIRGVPPAGRVVARLEMLARLLAPLV